MGESALPQLHATWFTALTGIPAPRSEPKATCGDCVMCAGVERSGSRVTFTPTTKCCTYIPHVANFLAGRALAGPGRDSVLQRVGRRAGVTPLGLGLSIDDIRRMLGIQSRFGRASVVRCPHFVEETSGCAIWEARNAVCSTWFCQHERGAVGQRFWHAVRDLLIAAEEQIARHCLEIGGLPVEQVEAVVAHRVAMRETVGRANAGEAPSADDAEDESAEWYARMWGDWAGREEEWFASCAESVAALDAGKLAARLDDVDRLLEDVGARRHDLDGSERPERLVFAPGAGSEAASDVVRLVGYSPFDPVVLPADLEPSLWLFDGRPVAEVLAQMRETHGVQLADDVIRRLQDFAVALPGRAEEAPHGTPREDPAAPRPVIALQGEERVLVVRGEETLDVDGEIVVR